MRQMLIALAATAGFTAAAFAQPPRDARPLSEILATIEASGDVAYFDEVEWDSDGYWEIEYYRADGGKVKIDVDPVSGETRR
ncbi:PepSY domain-containing protein [Aquibium carbonis]|uniref:PepSY domain-containing protein n=1 Tax=Aquibium carbonis TaxID=2495581 RepID=A0A429YZ55_9HYPH|nr:PepSY domain-containing protein [Aquibium carbonis]RST86703.1 PepSY domain-containing protein [Aquibium carbonis]